MVNPTLRRWLVPAIPFAVSVALSSATVGNRVFWQDSGFYLVAVKEMAPLYPPGFFLYQALCKAWTVLLFFVDFTLAVHLFSSLCAAFAAATLAVAGRDLLRARGPLFRVRDEDPSPVPEWAGAAAGCLAACGYTFWFTGIYAKGYSLYYLTLALLAWRMIRAHETGSPGEFTKVAALIGLSWAAHPSAAMLGPVLVAYVLAHRKTLGPRGIALRAGLSALCALGPSALLLLFGRRDSLYAFDDPTDPRHFLSYLAGSTFVSKPGAFGWDSSRLGSFAQYLWEEFLGVGLVAVTTGLAALARRNRRLLGAVALWLVPYATVTILFKLEGQHDCWFVASWIPLYLIAAVGLAAIGTAARAYARLAIGGATAAAIAWAAAANYPLLDQRRYDLAETFGHVYLDNLDPGAVLLISGDDAVATCLYLQRVRGVRTDVALINSPRLDAHTATTGRWYVDRMVRVFPFLKKPALEGGTANARGADLPHVVAEFLNANADCGRPIFTNVAPADRAVRPGIVLSPAGPLWKVGPKEEDSVDPKYWRLPVTTDQVRRRYGRERGQLVTYAVDDVIVKPECYERRLLQLLQWSKVTLATWHLKRGSYAKSAELFEAIRRSGPESASDAKILYALAQAYYGMNDSARARDLYVEVLRRTSEPNPCAGSLLYLGKIHRERGNLQEARRCWDLALQVRGIDDQLRAEIERSLRSP